MCDSIGSFSCVFWTLASVLLLLVIFEKPLIAYEDKKHKGRMRKKRLKELEEETLLQREIIISQFKKRVALENKLMAQKRINEINLEALRLERMKNREEVKQSEKA